MTSSLVSIGSGDRHVLAVHGWFGSARGWGSLPDFLDRSAYTYAFMDLRGYGGRKQVAGEFTMEEAAADAIVLAGELGLGPVLGDRALDGRQGGPAGAAAGPGPGGEAGRPQPGAGQRGAHGRAGLAAVLRRGGQRRQPGGDHQLHHRQQADRDLHQPRGPALAGGIPARPRSPRTCRPGPSPTSRARSRPTRARR